MRNLGVSFYFVMSLHAMDTSVPARLQKSATKWVLLAHII